MINAIAVTGNRVSYRGLHATLTALPDSTIALTFDDERHKTIIKPRKEVESEYGRILHLIPKNEVPSSKRLDLSVADLDELKRRSAYIDELRRIVGKGGVGGTKVRKSVIKRVSRQIDDKKPVSPATLARWAARANVSAHGVVATLTPRTRKRDSLFSEEVRELALGIIDDYYLKTGQPTVQYAYDCFVEEFEEKFGEDVEPPCRETFRKWARSAVDPIEFIRKRVGEREAKAAARNAKRKIRFERILERTESDSVKFAIPIRDEKGVYLAPVQVFAVLDCCSRAVLGLIVQLGYGETSSSVIDSYKHAICPKSIESLPANVTSDWPMYGVPEVFVSDGGTGYTSMATQSFILDAGSQSQIVETYAGWRKPFVERFFLTMRTHFAQKLHSYCGKHTDRQNLDATFDKKASMTLDEFRAELYEWVVDKYHHRPHSGLNGRTPYEVWQEQAYEMPPFVPTHFERIQLTMGESRVCTISGQHAHQGIQINTLRYNDTESKIKMIGMKLRAHGLPAEVTVQYTNNDLYSVTVIDPFTDELIPAFVTDPAVSPGTSLGEFNRLRPKMYRNKGYTGQGRAKPSRGTIEANRTHDLNTRRGSSRSSRSAPLEGIHAGIQQRREEGFRGGEDTDWELDDLDTQASELDDSEFDEEEYEDD